jgi:hypothetical protein
MRSALTTAFCCLCLLAAVPPEARAEFTVFAHSMENIEWDSLTHLRVGGGTPTIVQTDQVAHTGTYSALFPYTPPAIYMDQYLVTPALDFSGHPAITLTLYEYQEWWTLYGDEHQVCVSTTVPDDPAAFATVVSMTPENHPIPDGEWQELTVDLSAFAGEPTVYIGLRYRGADADNWYVDDIAVTAPFQNNLGILDYLPPPLPARLGQPFVHRVNVANTGIQPLVGAALNWNLFAPDGSLFAQESRDLSGMGPGEDQVVEFATSPTLAGFYASQAWVTTEGDEDPSDDSRSGGAAAYSLGRTPVGMLGFNANHPPSQEAEDAFDLFPEVATNGVGLIRLPSPLPNGDVGQLYYHAAEDINFFRNGMAGRPDLPDPPEFDADNLLDERFFFDTPFYKRGVDGWAEIPTAWMALAQEAGSPLALSTDIEWLIEPDWGELHVTIEVVDGLKPGVDYLLYSALVEDDAGGTGHNQVLRKIFPGHAGLVIDPDPGTHQYVVYIIRAEEWVAANLRLVTFVVERNGDGTFGPIVNGDVRWWLEAGTPVQDTPALVQTTRLVGNAPNPFNPATVITYELARDEAVTLEIFDLAGRLVRRLEAVSYTHLTLPTTPYV